MFSTLIAISAVAGIYLLAQLAFAAVEIFISQCAKPGGEIYERLFGLE